MMQLIGRDFEAGRHHWTSNHLATALDVPGVALAPILTSLESAGLIVATEREYWMPARSMDTITLVEIMVAIRGTGMLRPIPGSTATSAADALMTELDAAMREKLGARTLADLAGS
ncbi:MAG: hypothetical protein JSR95_09645 [Proteobacteria bacterium]|nr:hypothetical protein [Pseudomonadota bacterium]